MDLNILIHSIGQQDVRVHLGSIAIMPEDVQDPVSPASHMAAPGEVVCGGALH